MNNQILQDKEQRYLLQKQLWEQYHCALITVSLNIPGPEKDVPLYRDFFYQVVVQNLLLFCVANKIALIEKLYHSGPAGPYLIICLKNKQDYHTIKKLLVNYETTAKFYQIVDFDVFDEQQNKISRTDCHFSARTCYLCANEAKICSKKQSHDLVTLTNYLTQLIESALTENYAK